MEHEVDGPIEYRSLSENQKRLVAILPIPSAILSLIGSSLIVYMAMRSRRNTEKKWTPYNRLIMGLSSFDILTSITAAFASLLYPKETSNKAWVFGNETTCSMVGAFNQLIYGVILYYCCLSIYFLLTARFGFTNSQISRRVEPLMHVFCFGYPLVTSFVGLFMGAYDEPEIGMGCWIKRWPKRCIAYREPVDSEEACRSTIVGWALGGWIGATTTIISFFATIILIVHVRREGKKLAKTRAVKSTPTEEAHRSSVFKTEMMSCEQSMHNYEASINNHDESENGNSKDELVSSIQSVPEGVFDERAGQLQHLKRLKLVRTQAILYFFSYFCTSGWAQLLRLIESMAESAVEEKELPYTFYFFVLCQCVLYPLQGFTNLLVFVRPKYLKLRAENPDEPRWYVLKLVIFEEDDHPLERTPTSSRSLISDAMRQELKSEEGGTQKALSVDNESCSTTQYARKASLDNTAVTSPYLSPVPSGPAKTVVSTVSSVASVASSGDSQMKEVMERTKRRLEKCKAARMTKTGSSSSLNPDQDDDASLGMMSPIQKVRAKMKLQAPAIPDIFNDSDDDAPPMPIPETVDRTPSTSRRKRSMSRGKGSNGPSAVRMDGSIMQGDSSEFEHDD